MVFVVLKRACVPKKCERDQDQTGTNSSTSHGIAGRAHDVHLLALNESFTIVLKNGNIVDINLNRFEQCSRAWKLLMHDH